MLATSYYSQNYSRIIIASLVMGLSEKSGWGQKFPTLEPPGVESIFLYLLFIILVLCTFDLLV